MQFILYNSICVDVRKIFIYTCFAHRTYTWHAFLTKDFQFETDQVNLCLSKFSSCLKIPVNRNSVDCRVTVFGAFTRNFFAFTRSVSQEIITALAGHDDGGRTNGLPPQELIMPIKMYYFNKCTVNERIE